MKKNGQATHIATIARTTVAAALVAALGTIAATPAMAEPLVPDEGVPIVAQSDGLGGPISEDAAQWVARAYTGLTDPATSECAMLGLVESDGGLVYRAVIKAYDGSGYRVDMNPYTGAVLECRYDDSCLFVTPDEAVDAVMRERHEDLVAWARTTDAVEGWFYYVATHDAWGTVTVSQVDMMGNVYHTWMSLDDVLALQ